MELSARYIHDRKLPDKAIDVIDESGAAQMLVPEFKRKKTIGLKEIELTISTMARIPPKTVSKDDAEVLAHLDETLKRVVYGQDKALTALTSAIKLARAGLRDPEKPIGCYLFSGPTGVGKTEAARQLATSLGIELIRFDMSEYMERHTVSRLIGAPPGYVGFDQGGLLTDGIDQHPHCVLLLDEIEKAHSDLFNILLQVMDHGKLTDHNGKQIDFRNVILIMTTNAGAADLARKRPSASRAARCIAPRTMRRSIGSSPRSSATVSTRSSTSAICRRRSSPRVVDKFVLQLEAQLADRNVTIELADEARAWLVERGYDQAMGARPMARVIHTHIKTPLADEVLFGKLKNGGAVRVVVVTDEMAPKTSVSSTPRGRCCRVPSATSSRPARSAHPKAAVSRARAASRRRASWARVIWARPIRLRATPALARAVFRRRRSRIEQRPESSWGVNHFDCILEAGLMPGFVVRALPRGSPSSEVSGVEASSVEMGERRGGKLDACGDRSLLVRRHARR